MIVVLTPNPSIDRTLRVPRLERGALVRATSVTAEAAGKGINVTRALLVQRHAAAAVAPLSTASAPQFAEALGPRHLKAVTIDGDVRVNVTMVEPDGTVTKVNEPGPRLTAEEASALIDRAVEVARDAGAHWVVGSGSLPPGVVPDLYARLIRALPVEARSAVDADGAALAAAVDAAATLVKPNLAELEELVGRRLTTLGEVVDAAREVIDRGPAGVLASLGRDGAVYVDAAGASHAEAAIDDVVNTVGAGDALLAGFLAAGADHAALSTAVAWSVAACRSPGSRIRPVGQDDVAAVVLHAEPSPARQLGVVGLASPAVVSG